MFKIFTPYDLHSCTNKVLWCFVDNLCGTDEGIGCWNGSEVFPPTAVSWDQCPWTDWWHATNQTRNWKHTGTLTMCITPTLSAAQYYDI